MDLTKFYVTPEFDQTGTRAREVVFGKTLLGLLSLIARFSSSGSCHAGDSDCGFKGLT